LSNDLIIGPDGLFKSKSKKYVSAFVDVREAQNFTSPAINMVPGLISLLEHNLYCCKNRLITNFELKE